MMLNSSKYPVFDSSSDTNRKNSSILFKHVESSIRTSLYLIPMDLFLFFETHMPSGYVPTGMSYEALDVFLFPAMASFTMDNKLDLTKYKL